MNASKFKAVCCWIITLYLALDLTYVSLTMLSKAPINHLLCPDSELRLAGPQEGFGD